MEKAKLLIVDDEALIRKALGRVLRAEPVEVLEAENAAEALKLLVTEPVALVITDYRMPGMDGLDFLRLVRERCPDTIRIMLTGHGDMSTAIQAINQGDVFRFFTKPWDQEELLHSVQKALKLQHIRLSNRQLIRDLEEQLEHLRGHGNGQEAESSANR